jgi:hypothetical protein
MLALLMALALAAVSVTPTFAAKPTGGTSSSSLSLVVLYSPYNDGLPHWDGQVTFNISTTATTHPYVDLNCYQSGTLVYGAMAGFFASYPWQGTQNMTLSSASWTGGAASCTATLYYLSGTKKVILSTLTFQAYA